MPSIIASLPVKGSLFPLVNKPYDEDSQKHHDRPKAKCTNILERHRPRKQECNFKIKQNEKDGNQVVAHIELHARIPKGLKTAFVRRVFCRIREIGSEDVSKHLWRNTDTDANQDEQENWQVLIKTHKRR